MASTGDTLPTSGTTVDRAGATAWTNPQYITADDTNYTTAAVPTDYLIASAFGFSIPTTATILGVTVKVNASETGTGSSNYIPQLISAATPTLIGSAKSAVAVSGSTKVTSTNGGTADLWSATLTPAIVNDAGFGVAIWSTDTVNTLSVDWITIAVEYEDRGAILAGVAGTGEVGTLVASEAGSGSATGVEGTGAANTVAIETPATKVSTLQSWLNLTATPRRDQF